MGRRSSTDGNTYGDVAFFVRAHVGSNYEYLLAKRNTPREMVFDVGRTRPTYGLLEGHHIALEVPGISGLVYGSISKITPTEITFRKQHPDFVRQ